MFKQVKTGIIHHKKLTQQQSRSVTSSKLIVDDFIQKDKLRRSMVNLYGQRDGNLGIVKMNKEHRYNTLTLGLINDITRGIDTMNNDHTLHAIFLGTEKGQHWSHGSDFKSILHMKKEDNYTQIQEYMQALYHLQTNIASINKPLIGLAPGHAMNSGAAFLAAISHPLTTVDAKIAFNEVSFGFVPHAGASFYMSRMPGEFGTFMALTGLSIRGSDAAVIDIARGIVHNIEDYAKEVSDHVTSMPYPMIGGEELFRLRKDEEVFVTPWQYHVRERQIELEKLKNADTTRMFRQQRDLENFDPLLDPNERIPSSVSEANFRYMKMLRNDAQNNKPEDTGYLEFGEHSSNRSSAFIYNNYFNDVMQYVIPRIGDSYSTCNSVAVLNKQLIDRCFFSNSVEEIMENLKKETHPFALKMLNAMKRNSPQSMQLALKMLRNAQNLDYKGCLQMELNVAFHRIQDSEFDLGIQQVLGVPNTKGVASKPIPQWAPYLKASELDRYFQESAYSKGVDLQVVENALLPTKNYYERFSDQVRLWLNETSATQSQVREVFDLEAKQALQEQGIDVRDLALTPEIARNHMYAKIAKERTYEVQAQRAEQLMTDQKLRDQYFERINKEVEKFATNDQYFYKTVNNNISECFQDAYFGRLDHVFKKSSEAHNLEKRRLLVRMKKFFFKQRILAYNQEHSDRQIEQLKSMPFQQIHMSEKWDKSFRDQQHPDLHKSPLYYLSKVIGRVSITPPELTKAYITDPEKRNQLTMFTLNKSELEKLNEDVLSNPEKYEMIFRGHDIPEIDSFKVTKAQRDLALNKLDEYEYWYRTLNSGACHTDTWTYNSEFKSYKEWAELIETKAMNTLRTAINKLIMDHENSTEYSGSLKNLVKFINQPAKVESKKTQKKATTKLGDKTRSLDELKDLIKGMLKNDPFLGHLFQPERDNKNDKVIALKNEFESELLKLVEIVLLDKDGPISPYNQEEMQRRLAELTNPQKSIQRSLNLIDEHLAKKNGEALVKDAFELVTPFFAQMMQNRLKQEAIDLLALFNNQNNQGEILVFYFMNKSFPNIKKNATLHKFMTYSFDKDVYDRAIKQFPYLTQQFQRRELVAMLGGEDIIKRATLGETMYDSLEKTNNELKQLENFEKSVARDGKFKLATEAEKEKYLQLTDHENRELAQIQTNMCDIYEFLYENKYEIDHHMNDFDLLQIYSESIKLHDLDVAPLIGTGSKKQHETLADYAVFVAELVKGLENTKVQHRFDAMGFMESQNTGEVQQQTFYSTARAERQRALQAESDLVIADRHSIIKKQINDFNSLKNQVKSHKESAEQLAALIKKQKQSTQNDINSFLNNSMNVDIDLLAKKIKMGDFEFLKSPEQVIDITKVINQSKHQFERFDSAVDVISLHQLKGIIEQDNETNKQQKQSIKFIVDYVMEQTKYLSNAERKNLTIKDFLEKYHFSNHKAYLEYTSDLLKYKIEGLLGKTDTAVPDIIEWQLANTRTLPSEHTTNQLDAELRFQVDPEVALEILEKYDDSKYSGSDSEGESHEIDEDKEEHQGQTNKYGKKDQSKQTKNPLTKMTRQELLADLEKLKEENDNEEIEINYEVIELKLNQASELETVKKERVEQYDEQKMLKRLKQAESEKHNKKERKALYYNEDGQLYSKSLRTGIHMVLKEAQGFNTNLTEADYVRLKEVQYTNPVTGNEELDTFRTYENKQVLREAKELSEIPQSMIPTKNLYEHKILKEMIEADLDEGEVNRIIEEYTNIRLQGCQLNKRFADAIRQENASIYMKVLREQIVDELGLGAPAEGFDISYNNITDEFKNQQFFDIENAYNMQNLNNANAIGYDKLLERAQSESAAENLHTAHESVFDKLLADYYLGKRGEYKESNKLLKELSQIFEDPTAKKYGTTAIQHLEQTNMRQNIDKGDHPLIRTDCFREMIKLDVVASQAMQKNKNGLSESLRSLSITEKDHPEWILTQVPEYFEVMDVRKPADLYVKDKLNQIIQECFELRAKLEKKMTRHELVAFDKVLTRYLQKDKLMPRLQQQIDFDYNLAHNAKTLINMHQDNKQNMDVQKMKVHHNQRDYNKKIQNEDAEYKLLAYSATIDRKNQKDMLKKEDTEAMYNTQSFEEYYKNELTKDAQKAPRPINPTDYQARKPWDSPVGTPFRGKKQRIADLELDYSIYNENKLEQQDRIKLFYTLEQYYEQARKTPDPNSKGEKLIREYFADPENTFFFDKNKLV